MLTKHQKTREERKLRILAEFEGGEKLYTNQVATRLGLTWPVTDRLLQQLVVEGRLFGNKLGYTVEEPKKPTLMEKIKDALHV